MKTLGIFLVGLLSFDALAIRGVGNAGDESAQEFSLIAREIGQLARREFPELELDAVIARVLDATMVESESPEELGTASIVGPERAAANFPDQTPPLIVLNRDRWQRKLSYAGKVALVVHEIYGIAKLEENRYGQSAKIAQRVIDALLETQRTPVVLFDQPLVGDREGLRYAEARELCAEKKALFAIKYFFVRCHFRASLWNVDVREVEYVKGYKFMGYEIVESASDESRARGDHRRDSGSSELALRRYYVREDYEHERHSGRESRSAAWQSVQRPVILETWTPVEVTRTVQNSVYGVTVFGIGELGRLPEKTLYDSRDFLRGSDGAFADLDLAFRNPREALQNCLDRRLEGLRSPQQSLYVKSKCRVEKSGDQFQYRILSQNPYL